MEVQVPWLEKSYARALLATRHIPVQLPSEGLDSGGVEDPADAA